MSRKLNNIRRRLEIRQKEIVRLAGENREPVATVRRMLKEQVESDRSLARAVMITVSKNDFRFDTWAAQIRFQPEAFRFVMMRRPSAGDRPGFMNLSYEAERVGYEIGKMATRAIIEAGQPEGRR